MTIPLSSIDTSDRYRTEYKRIPELAESIKLYGLIQPIILSQNPDSTFKLIAGGRRMRALESLGITELTHGLTCTPNQAGFAFPGEVLAEETIREMEFEENRQRESTTWQEDILFMKKLERAYAKKASLESTPWGQRQAGMLLGVSLGRANAILTVGDRLLAKDKEITEAGSLENALRILLGRKEDELNKDLARGTLAQGHSFEPGQKTSLDVITIDLGDLTTGTVMSKPIPQSCSVSEQNLEDGIEPELLAPGYENSASIEVPLSRMLFLGDFRQVIKGLKDSSVDHVITDIPYGIDMDNLDVNDQDRVADEHDVEENLALMPDFLRESYRVVKDTGFVCLWYDLDHHEKLQNMAKQIGFRVQRWPFAWVKTHSCRNQAATFNTTKSLEYCMFLRKGTATLVNPVPKGYVIADGSIERKMYRNPFAKPFEVWKAVMDAVAVRGQTVLDPFAGEMSSIRAMINLGLSPIAIELKENHFNAGLEHVKSAYNVLTRNKAKFV